MDQLLAHPHRTGRTAGAEGLAAIIEDILRKQGEPNAYIVGREAGGAFVLGALLEFLALAGPDDGWRRTVRVFAGTGLCGAFTTYSTFALETTQLGDHGAPGVAIAYAVVSVVLGLLAAGGGIALASKFTTRWAAR